MPPDYSTHCPFLNLTPLQVMFKNRIAFFSLDHHRPKRAGGSAYKLVQRLPKLDFVH